MRPKVTWTVVVGAPFDAQEEEPWELISYPIVLRRARAAPRSRARWPRCLRSLRMLRRQVRFGPRHRGVSNRADLVSGGDVLVRVTLPRGHAAPARRCWRSTGGR